MSVSVYQQSWCIHWSAVPQPKYWHSSALGSSGRARQHLQWWHVPCGAVSQMGTFFPSNVAPVALSQVLSFWCLLRHLPGWWWLWLCSLLSCFSMILSFQHPILLLWKIRGIFKQTAALILQGKLGQISPFLVSPRLTEILPFKSEFFSPHPHLPPALGPVWPHYELLQHIKEKRTLSLLSQCAETALYRSRQTQCQPQGEVALTSWAQATERLSQTSLKLSLKFPLLDLSCFFCSYCKGLLSLFFHQICVFFRLSFCPFGYMIGLRNYNPFSPLLPPDRVALVP